MKDNGTVIFFAKYESQGPSKLQPEGCSTLILHHMIHTSVLGFATAWSWPDTVNRPSLANRIVLAPLGNFTKLAHPNYNHVSRLNDFRGRCSRSSLSPIECPTSWSNHDVIWPSKSPKSSSFKKLHQVSSPMTTIKPLDLGISDGRCSRSKVQADPHEKHFEKNKVHELRSQVSILGPLGYGPSTLPLRHFASRGQVRSRPDSNQRSWRCKRHALTNCATRPATYPDRTSDHSNCNRTLYHWANVAAFPMRGSNPRPLG